MPVYLGLGSNVGDRMAHLRAAVDALRVEPGVTVLRESQVYETEPIGETNQVFFLNMIVSAATSLAPEEFLGRMQAIEKRLGRVPTRRWGPRVIDIDIVLWDGVVVVTEHLTIPHPEFRARAFVLLPLAEIAPDATDPATGERIEVLAGRVSGRDGVKLVGALNVRR
ncbi:MAG: 2-amino-4-hydroxy-6-hydroxymethyldihydropteridine diphosphokinase [Candidatus Hydrogenedentes bacterium]|nr:2-amino-4-hydroxy-6-hydroxymethyldihydropteridine diphosphokinase [Candidatus Hydrogenedentota bacterium]